MIKMTTKYGHCYVEPDYVRALYPLESELSFTESGLAEVKCYAALENGETLELLESVEAVFERLADARKEAPIEPGGTNRKRGETQQQ